MTSIANIANAQAVEPVERLHKHFPTQKTGTASPGCQASFTAIKFTKRCGVSQSVGSSRQLASFIAIKFTKRYGVSQSVSQLVTSIANDRTRVR